MIKEVTEVHSFGYSRSDVSSKDETSQLALVVAIAVLGFQLPFYNN